MKSTAKLFALFAMSALFLASCGDSKPEEQTSSSEEPSSSQPVSSSSEASSSSSSQTPSSESSSEQSSSEPSSESSSSEESSAISSEESSQPSSEESSEESSEQSTEESSEQSSESSTEESSEESSQGPALKDIIIKLNLNSVASLDAIYTISYNRAGVAEDGEWSSYFSDDGGIALEGRVLTLNCQIGEDVTKAQVYFGIVDAEHKWVENIADTAEYDIVDGLISFTMEEPAPEPVTKDVALSITLASAVEGTIYKIAYDQSGTANTKWGDLYSDDGGILVDGKTLSATLKVAEDATKVSIYLGTVNAEHAWVSNIYETSAYDIVDGAISIVPDLFQEVPLSFALPELGEDVLKVSYNPRGTVNGNWTELYSDTNADAFDIKENTVTVNMTLNPGVTEVQIYVGIFTSSAHAWKSNIYSGDPLTIVDGAIVLA